MPGEFQGKVIIVTGAASGIGRATSKKLAAEGASLALCDVDLTGLTSLMRELPGDHHKAYITDINRSDDCNNLVSSVTSVQNFGRIDHLFNCAGINPRFCLLQNTTDAMWDKLVGTNLRGPYNMTRACIPHLSSGSAIVNVSSMAGIRASAGLAIYNTTKFGIIGFSKAMALELGPREIRVNVVAPGPIATPTNMAVVEGEAAVASAEKDIALGRMGQPEEVADAVCYLLSDKSSFINGAVIEISGGM